MGSHSAFSPAPEFSAEWPFTQEIFLGHQHIFGVDPDQGAIPDGIPEEVLAVRVRARSRRQMPREWRSFDVSERNLPRLTIGNRRADIRG
jgi:hypothetical protein